MATVEVRRFTKADIAVWNDFVAVAKNATFLFHRNYMDYHAHRFADHSLLIFQNGKLKALFVANEVEDKIVSHGGLSYGGLILEKEARLEDVLSFFFHLVRYYSHLQFNEIFYKCLPSYYACYPSQEDLYAMFLLKATLAQRDTSSVFVKSMPLPYQQRRKKNSKEEVLSDFRVIEERDPKRFWEMVLAPNLRDRFGAEPVHSLNEMRLLMSLFPDNVRLFEIHGGEILGGTVIYSTGLVAHAQYTSSTALGKELGALDVLFHHLMKGIYEEKSFFSFGTSNGEPGSQLNRGLVNWKEGFGARTFVVDSYKIKTDKYPLLADYA
jgi:hypothetical protein